MLFTVQISIIIIPPFPPILFNACLMFNVHIAVGIQLRMFVLCSLHGSFLPTCFVWVFLIIIHIFCVLLVFDVSFSSSINFSFNFFFSERTLNSGAVMTYFQWVCSIYISFSYLILRRFSSSFALVSLFAIFHLSIFHVPQAHRKFAKESTRSRSCQRLSVPMWLETGGWSAVQDSECNIIRIHSSFAHIRFSSWNM